MERFIHRFSLSPYKDKLILKGGLMFYVWHLASSRATRDIDFLGITPNNPNNIHKIITQICDIDYTNDGVIFIKDSIQCIGIQEQNDEPLIFTDDYKQDKNRNQQWNAFIRKNTLSITPANFIEAMGQIKLFTEPVVKSYSPETAFNKRWLAPGPWTTEAGSNNMTELFEQKEFL